MTIEKMLRWVVLGGVFALPFIPLLVAHSLFFPFITGKNFTFRIIIEVITAAWLGLAILNPRYRPRFSWPLVTATVFVAVIGLADLLGLNSFKSFWSNYERMEGWVTLVHLLMFLTVALSTLTTEKLWKGWWHTSIGVSVLIGIYGLMQMVGFITINQGGGRLDATFGNATYLAVYMLFHLFITAAMWARYAIGNRPLQYTYGAILFLQAFILFFTETRGAILGALGGALLASLIVVVFSSRSAIAWRVATGIVVVLVLLSGTLYLMRDTSIVRNTKSLSRLTSISITESSNVARFYNWGMAWQGVKERPLLGWGQEGYNLVFNKYYDPRMYAQEPWFDRVHNIIFDWLIAGGFIGFFAYLAFFGSVVWAAWKSHTVLERGILIGLLGGYFFYLLFTFDNIISYVLFFALAAFLASRTVATRSEHPAPNYPEAVQYSIALGAVVLAVGSVWLVNVPALQANQTLIQAVQSQQAGPTKNLEYFEKVATSGTFGAQEAREHLIQATAQMAGNPNIDAATKQKFFEVSEREMLAQIQQAPLDARFPLFLGVLYDAFGQYDKAKEQLEAAQRLSPNKQTIAMQVGLNALNRGDTKAAITVFEQAYNLATENDSARLFYGSALIRDRQFEKADELLAPLKERDALVDNRILSAYATVGRFDKIAEIWSAHIIAKPEDLQSRFTLAAAYYQGGDRVRAVQVLQEIIANFPEGKAQAEQLLLEVQKGTAKVQ